MSSAAATSTALDYRADLDGMRAVAVIAVIVYHLDASWLPGGFVGVDVFFVLSGFFITRLLARDLSSDTFDLVAFYDRRIRRLFPVLVAVLIASTVAASILLMPSALEQYGRHLVAAVLSVGNIAFWLDSGYFAADAETFPLLHTWSLAVEEQFYLVFPVLLWTVWRVSRRAVVPVVWALTVASFALSLWLVEAHPSAAFYLTPARMWELTLGSLLALGAVPAPSAGWQRAVAGWLGFALVLGSFGWLTASMAFPGLGALAPCLGTALIIWAGLGSASEGFLPRMLSVRPMVFIGLLSYSLYLWHWPLIVFAREATGGDLTLGLKLALAVAMTLLAYLSWRFVEQPFRRGDRFWPERRQRWTYAGGAAVVLSSVGLSAHALEGYPQRLSIDAKTIAAYQGASSPDRPRCHAKVRGQDRYKTMCRFGPRDGERLIVFTDSHGTELSYALKQRAKDHDLRITQVTGSACPPAIGYNSRLRTLCAPHTDRMLAAILKDDPATVLVAANYELWNNDVNRDQFWIGYEQTIEALIGAGHRVVLLGPIPTDHSGPLPETLTRLIRLGQDPRAYRFEISGAMHEDILPNLAGIVGRQPVNYVPVMPFLCGEEAPETCRGMTGNIVHYYDTNHPSVPMAEKLLDEVILPVIKAD